MKTQIRKGLRRFQLELLGYGNSYYIERIAELETVLTRKPKCLQLDMVGMGEIPADFALLIRSVLLGRSPKTQIVTVARSSLQGGSVLVWLLGDRRIIRDDARLFFRRANSSEYEVAQADEDWQEAQPKYRDSSSEFDPEEGDYARMLEGINEFLPVKELADRVISVPVLRQFGLVESEKADEFLASAFGKTKATPSDSLKASKVPRARNKARKARPRPAKK